MTPEALIAQLEQTRDFFDRVVAPLTEDDSTFRPNDAMFTVAQHVAHAAQTVDWFIDGAFFRDDGFDLDFAAHEHEVRDAASLDAARAWWIRAMDRAIAVVRQQAPSELSEPLPAGPVMGGAPRGAIVAGIADHSTHHRGALAVYARLVGKTPGSPYSDDGTL